MGDQVDRTIWAGNLNTDEVTERLLWELFLQAGPLDSISIAKEKDGRPKNFAFVTFQHAVSVPYTIELMNGLRLCGKDLKLQIRPGSCHENNRGNSRNNSNSQMWKERGGGSPSPLMGPPNGPNWDRQQRGPGSPTSLMGPPDGSGRRDSPHRDGGRQRNDNRHGSDSSQHGSGQRNDRKRHGSDSIYSSPQFNRSQSHDAKRSDSPYNRKYSSPDMTQHPGYQPQGQGQQSFVDQQNQQWQQAAQLLQAMQGGSGRDMMPQQGRRDNRMGRF